MARGENGTPEKPGGGDRAPVSTLDVRSLRDLVASAASAAAPITVDRPYAEALRNSVDWLWQTDKDFNLTYVSRALDEIGEGSGPGESWLGRSLLSLADAEADEATPSPLLVALRERRAFRDCTVEWTSEAQQRVRFRLTGLPFTDQATGAFAGFRGTASASSDPAEESQTARELLDLLKAALSERDELQQQLAAIEDESLKERLAGIAHELRTPLNAIIGFSELIRDQSFGNDPRRYAEYGGNIHRSGLKLLQLVNRILDTAEHESDLQAIEVRPFDIETVVRSIVEIMGDSAASGRVSLYLDVADDMPPAQGDRQMTRQILFHLLSRILERAPEGWSAGLRILADDGADDDADDGGEDSGDDGGEGRSDRRGGTGVQVVVWDRPAADTKGERAALVPVETREEIGTSEPAQATSDAGVEAVAEPEDLGPVVLRHLAETMGASLELTGTAGRGSEARLRLPPVPDEPDD